MINDYSPYYEVVHFQNYKQTCEESNIINNSQEYTTYGTLHCCSGTITINKCCLIKNNEIGNGKYLFVCNSGQIMEVRDCTIQSGYSISGAVTTSYSNSVAGSECAAISNCGTKNVKTNEEKKCSDWDIVLLHKIHLVWTILKYIKLVCYNNIFIKYNIIMCNMYKILYNYT
jgi:hypothetical protein